MNKKNTIEIGDMFLSWKVVCVSNSKKYRYKVRCIECGKEREFIKYNLLKGSYAPCKGCGHKKLKNIPLIKKHWNCELNGTIFDNPENFSLTQSYWFVCNQGHNFKSSIKDFKLERCLGCHENPPNLPSKVLAKEYIIRYFKGITEVLEPQPFLLYLRGLKVFIFLSESDRFLNYSNYFKTDTEMLDELEHINNLKQIAAKDNVRFIKFDTDKSFKKNVDRFKDLVIELTQEK